MKHLSFKRNAKGFSLIELLIVLGIIAILLVAAFIVYPQVRDRNQANAEVTTLTTIKANVTNLYAAKGGNYDNLTQTVAFNAKVFPAGMNATATGAVSSWGGAVTVEEGATVRTFDIAYTDVPAGVCLGMVAGAAGNFTDITDGTLSAYDATTGKFEPANAAALCAGDAAKDLTFSSN